MSNNMSVLSNRPAGRWEKLPPVLFSSFGSVSLSFLGPLAQGASHPLGYQGEPLSILQQRKNPLHPKEHKRWKSTVIYCVYITGVQTLIFSNGNLWHRARGILSAEGSFGLARTLTRTVPLANHESTNALKEEVIYLLALSQYTNLKKYSFQSMVVMCLETFWIWMYGLINCPVHSAWKLRNTR